MVIKPMAGQQHGWRATKNTGRGPSVHVQDCTIFPRYHRQSSDALDHPTTLAIDLYSTGTKISRRDQIQDAILENGILGNGTHSIRLPNHLVILSFHPHRDQTSICPTRRSPSIAATTMSRIRSLHKASPSSAISYHDNEA
jgi:hypothetical protein